MHSPRSRVLVCLQLASLLSVALYGREAQAFMGEENLWWAQAMAALSQQTAELRATGRLLHQQLLYAEQTAQWAHEAKRALHDIHVLGARPELWAQAAHQHFVQAYSTAAALRPRVQGQQAPLPRLSAQQEGPSAPPQATPLEALHRAQAQELVEGHAAAVANLAALEAQIAARGLTAASAPAYTARATSIAAAAHIRSAAALEALLHQQQRAQCQASEARARLRQHQANSRHSWRLQPWPEPSPQGPR